MSLFKLGEFTLHSGDKSYWKIDCDAFTNEDWDTIARMIYENVGRFKKVIGVPRGGLKLAKSLQLYCFPNPENPVLIVDDVLTTGNSMETMRLSIKQDCIGAVVFARGKYPSWITPLFVANFKDGINIDVN